MLYIIIYLTLILGLLFFLFFMSVYTLSLIYSSIMGSPYVATRKKVVEEILREANLKKGKTFIDLGCGDGRIVQMAVKHYQVKGIGVDINPLLIFWARFWSRRFSFYQNNKPQFRVENIFNTDLTKADYLYLFLMPKLIEKLKPKMEKELKKGALVISHGFKIIGWEKKLVKTLKVDPFWTYYYKVKS